MITPEDLPVVPVFASVAAEELARLAQTAGDVRLGAGDYAVHEGDERSLFVVLAGRIEVTKVIDGIERVIGQRAPGQIFGEVPIIFGTPYQGSYRATEPTRLMHLSARQLHALAAANPEVLTKVAAIAAERIGGLKGIATAPPSKRGLMLARPGDDSARQLRSFLDRNQISHDWVAADAPDRATRWTGPPLDDDQLPALVCDDGSLLTRARPREVAEHVGLQTQPRAGTYDAVIVGGGPAGLAAAVYGASDAVVAGTRQHQAARARRRRGDSLQPADPLGRDRRHLRQHLRLRRGQRVELPRREVHQARRFSRAVAALVGRAEDDRHLAEDLARRALADDAFDAVDDLGDLDASGQHHEQRALVAFVHGVVTGAEPDIAGGLRQAREVLGRHRGENGDAGEVLGRDHGCPRRVRG